MAISAPPSALTAAQRRQLLGEGYVQLPGAVPRPLIDAALRAINFALSGGMPELCVVPGPRPGHSVDIIETLKAAQKTAAVNDLLRRSPLLDLCRSVLGELAPLTDGWLVLRYPQPEPEEPGRIYHIDGLHTGDNSINPGEITTRSAKIVVYLSDVPGQDCGNFTVCPGSHLQIARHLRETGWESLLRGMPKLPFAAPRQLVGRAGDAFLCSYLLVHDGVQNLSPNIRYAAFFDLDNAEHPRLWKRSLTEPWLEWPGLAQAAPPAKTPRSRRTTGR